MKNEQQSGQQSSQGSQQSPTRQELDSIIRGAKFVNEQDANTYLKQHGLSCTMKEGSSTADIFRTQNNERLASVQFTGQQDQRQISGIAY